MQNGSDPRFLQGVATLKHFDANSLEGNWNCSSSPLTAGKVREGTFICREALWTPRCHLPCHVTVL